MEYSDQEEQKWFERCHQLQAMSCCREALSFMLRVQKVTCFERARPNQDHSYYFALKKFDDFSSSLNDCFASTEYLKKFLRKTRYIMSCANNKGAEK